MKNTAPVVVGSTVQYIDGMGTVRAAIIVFLSEDSTERRANLIAFDRVTAGNLKLVVGVLELDADASVLQPDRWRPLPIAPAPVAEFPVHQFIEIVRPLIEEAARMRVEEILAERSSSS